MRNFLPAFGAALASLAASPSVASAADVSQPSGWGPPMMWGWGWYGMFFGPLFMILVLATTVAVIVLLVRWLGGSWQGSTPPHSGQGSRPIDILKERFARGEIDKNEFEERRRVLGE